jgi:hypothetical protein
MCNACSAGLVLSVLLQRLFNFIVLETRGGDPSTTEMLKSACVAAFPSLAYRTLFTDIHGSALLWLQCGLPW